MSIKDTLKAAYNRVPDGERFNIIVPSQNKDACKELGARWDQQNKTWYFHSDDKTHSLLKFLPANFLTVIIPGDMPFEGKKDLQKTLIDEYNCFNYCNDDGDWQIKIHDVDNNKAVILELIELEMIK